MKSLNTHLVCFCLLALCPSLKADDYRVEVLQEAPPADELSEQVAQQLNATGFRVIRDTSRTVCDLWLCKEWSVTAGFEPTGQVLYPFKPGQLVGVIRYPRKASDFRDQDIGSGVYTMRYAQQPVDGAHVGTSPTRDFFLLVSAENDDAAAPVATDELIEKSAAAAESSHPAMLCLQRIRDPKTKSPSMRLNEEHDWWIVRLQGTASDGKKKTDLPIELVIVGTAAE